MKHTKGIWKVDETHNRGIVWDEYGTLIANCYRDWIDKNDEESIANAKLIAAAPELLEALRLLQDIAEHGGEDGKGESIHPEMFKIIANEAIKKATS